MAQAFLDSPQSHQSTGSPSASASARPDPRVAPPTKRTHSQTAPRPLSRNRGVCPPRSASKRLSQQPSHLASSSHPLRSRLPAFLQTAPPPPTPLPFQSITPPPKHASSP